MDRELRSQGLTTGVGAAPRLVNPSSSAAESPLLKTIAENMERVCDVHRALDQLLDRLAPVLNLDRAVPGDDKKSVTRVACSAATYMLENQRETIVALHLRVMQLIAQLEV